MSIRDNWQIELLDYLNATVPNFSETSLVSAGADEIEKLRTLSGIDLPVDYLSFATLMGGSAGDLFSDFLAVLEIEAAIDFYEDPAVQSKADDLLVIGSGLMACYQELAISLRQESYGTIFDIDDDEIIGPVASSLLNLICQQVFFKYELKRPYNIIDVGLTRGQTTLEKISQIFVEYGFSLCSFSDEYNLAGRKQDMRCGAHQVSGGHGWIRIAGENEEQLQELKVFIEERLSV